MKDKKRQNKLWNCMEVQWEQFIKKLKQEENVDGAIRMTKI
jgi:hypothetical protein